ncbi:Region found in RelA / SpoT proteins [Pannonibacter phragmitetus]|uniref:Region found in RelA / SpoT proteins n=1 Tax=Pannonibacter phragmitetus TaxID=121719 RepID=A0A378ZXZ7_9HYPH|nr:hypothetical protein [Pannonibacter phragmitetus]SUB01948.1 Region found in RelA / SpoT proteins [Pannonibacter phragmitetus]
MSNTSILSLVNEYMKEDRKKAYIELHSSIENICKEIQTKLGVSVVRSIYGRSSKQGDLFKTNIKIAKKISKKRKQGNSEYTVKHVTDIIGLTAVMQYPDQVDIFLSELEHHLKGKFSIAKRELIRRPGYYATHVDIISDFPPHLGLFCELQVKTMLHDAWAAKMHDLNYKPGGELDPRLDRMMQVIADTIESIEIQSQTLRELITERWHAEALWRKAARLRMFESMPAWVTSREKMDPGALAALEMMISKKTELVSSASGSEILRDTQKTIANACKNLPRDLWVLFSYLASITGNSQVCDFAALKIDDWLGEIDLKHVEADEQLQYDIFSAPLACSAFGDLDRAIDISRLILKRFHMLSDHCNRVVKWNLANFIVERQYFLPEISPTVNDTKSEVESLVAECEPLRTLDPSCFFDFEGMMIVAFSNDPLEIKKAIKLIEKGTEVVQENDMELAEAFLELHSRMAWRRLLKLEAGH